MSKHNTMTNKYDQVLTKMNKLMIIPLIKRWSTLGNDVIQPQNFSITPLFLGLPLENRTGCPSLLLATHRRHSRPTWTRMRNTGRI
jgi:hypothetical protein